MQHTVRRNKRIFEYLTEQVKRVLPEYSLYLVYNNFIFRNLSVADSKEMLAYTSDDAVIKEDILDNDSVLMETLKFLGLLEVSTNLDELMWFIERKKEIKYGEPLTDFDKILKGIMAVPNKEK